MDLKSKKFVFDGIINQFPKEIDEMISLTNVSQILKERSEGNSGRKPYLTFDEVYKLWFLFRKKIDLSDFGLMTMDKYFWSITGAKPTKIFSSKGDCKRQVAQGSMAINKEKVDASYMVIVFKQK